jgi:hypothetical protein
MLNRSMIDPLQSSRSIDNHLWLFGLFDLPELLAPVLLVVDHGDTASRLPLRPPSDASVSVPWSNPGLAAITPE